MLFVERAESIGHVTFGDPHDGQSWLNSYPWKHAEYLLRFDPTAAHKLALQAVMEVRTSNRE